MTGKVSVSKNNFLRMVYEPEVEEQGDRASQVVSHTRPWFSVTNDGSMPTDPHSLGALAVLEDQSPHTLAPKAELGTPFQTLVPGSRTSPPPPA